jgi:8-oxo-dGTP diphosphatase
VPISDYLRGLREKIGHDLVLMPGAVAVVQNELGEILLHRRSDTGAWELPGGAIDPGEEPAEAVIREVLEETGIRVSADRLVGIYTEQPLTYPNGDVVSYIIMLFACHPTGETPQATDDETLEVRYFSPNALPTTLSQWHHPYIEHTLENRSRARFNFSGNLQ